MQLIASVAYVRNVIMIFHRPKFKICTSRLKSSMCITEIELCFLTVQINDESEMELCICLFIRDECSFYAKNAP